MSDKIQWWGYLHSNGSLQLKRWYGDHNDYTSDCYGNDFVRLVAAPFDADTREEAMEILISKLIPDRY